MLRAVDTRQQRLFSSNRAAAAAPIAATATSTARLVIIRIRLAMVLIRLQQSARRQYLQMAIVFERRHRCWPYSCGGSNHGFQCRSWVVPDGVIASANRT